jgi:hypothetical protein
MRHPNRRAALAEGFGQPIVAGVTVNLQDAVEAGELGNDPLPQDSVHYVIKLPAQIEHYPTRIALQLFQCFANALELLGMSVSPNLQRQPRRKPGIALPKSHPSLLRRRYQLIPRPLVKAAIHQIGDGLFHHGRIDGHALCAALVNGTGVPPSLDRLGQYPLYRPSGICTGYAANANASAGVFMSSA